MKVLYVDITSPIGHKNYNYRILSFISKMADVDVAFKKDYLIEFDKESINKIFSIPKEYFPDNLHTSKMGSRLFKIVYRLNYYKSMKCIEEIIKKNNYDIVFFSSIEVISFCLSTLNPKTKYVFVDHAITEIEKNKTKRFFWKRINKNIDVIVMENYIKDFLENKIGIRNKVCLLKHPLPDIEHYKSSKSDEINEKFIYAPSGSNDEEFVNYLLKNENLIKDFKIVIKSKKINYNSPNLYIFNSRISESEYYNLMLNCSFVLLPYDDDYNYRVSGVFYEAIQFDKMVLLNSNNSLEFYAERYPNTVLKYNGYTGFINTIKNLKDVEVDNEEIEQIKEEYSDKAIKNQLKSIFQLDEKPNDEYKAGAMSLS